MRTISNVWTILLMAGLCSKLIAADGVTPREVKTVWLTNLSQFYAAASTGYHSNYPVRLEGIVSWADPGGEKFILQDDSAAASILISNGGTAIRPGQRLLVQGVCSAERSGLSFVMSQALVVDNDGLHDAIEKSGSVYLKAGLNPVRLLWFNSFGKGVLNVFYQGPGVVRQRIPVSSLFRRELREKNSRTNYIPGLNYRCWEGGWDFVPEFENLPVVAAGVAADFDVKVRTRLESVGLEFAGSLSVPQDGWYTFYTQSDDGSMLFVGPLSLRLTSLGEVSEARPHPLEIGKILSAEEDFRYCEVEGEVTFVEERHRALRLELKGGDDRLTLDISDAQGIHPQLLWGSRVRARGICHSTATPDGRKVAGFVWVPSWSEVEVQNLAPDRLAALPALTISNLTTSGGVVQPSDFVRLRGQVRTVGSDRSLVMEDPTGTMTVYCSQPPPQVGSMIEAAGIWFREGTNQALKESFVRVLLPDPGIGDGELPLLTTIRQVKKLSSEEAALAYPVRVRGVVTAKFETGLNLVVQDGDQGIFIGGGGLGGGARARLEIGDECEIIGITCSAAWAPKIDAQQVTRLGLGRLPDPLHPSWDQILNGSLDSQYVEFQGIVTEVHETGVTLITRVGKIEMDLGGKSPEECRRLEDALIRVRGCVLAVYDRATHLVISGKVRFIHPSITVDQFAPTDSFTISAKRVASLRSFDPQANAFQRVRVSGQLVYAHKGLYALMDGTNGLRFVPKKEVALPSGAMIDAVGILDMSGPSPILHEAAVRQRYQRPLPAAKLLAVTNLLQGALDATLVQVESYLLNVNRDSEDQVLELRTGAHVHTARLNVNLGILRPIPIGSRLAVTGVYLGKGGNWAAGRDIEDFDLVLNSAADIAVLERPSWWTSRRLLGLVGSLAAVLILALAWIRVLRRRVEERTRELEQQIQARERVEQQRAVELERTRLARDLHDDLGGGLTEISMLGSLANDAVMSLERKAGYLQQMTEKARQLVTALDEIVWAVNPRYDSVTSLAGYYSMYAQRFLSLASLTCHLDVAETLPNSPLDSKVRHSLFLAFKEALNNVVRHAGASEVRLRILVEKGELIVAVSDNGRGLQPGHGLASGMDGLANMRARMAALGGRCEILSTTPQGTSVLFGVRLPQENHD